MKPSSNLPPDNTTPIQISARPGGIETPAVERLAVGATISLVGKVLGRGLEFLKQIALARLLSVESFGLYSLIWNLLRMAGIIAPAGLQNGVIQFGTPFHLTNASKFKDVLLRSLGLCLTFAIVLSALLWIGAPWLANNFFNEPGFAGAFRAFVLVLPPMVGLRVAANATRISQKMQYAVYTEELMQSVAALTLFLLLFMSGWRLWGAIWATTLSFTLAFILSCYYLWRLFPAALRAKRRFAVSNHTLLAYSTPTAFSGMFSLVISRLDLLLIGYFLTATEVGVYQVAAQFSIVFAVVLNGFNAIFGPIVAALYNKGRYTELQELFCISTKWGVYASAPLVLIIFTAPASLIEGLFGAPYLSAITPLLILTAGQIINVAGGGVGRLLIMTGKQNAWFLSSGAMMIVSFALNMLLIPHWGIVGAAIATAVSVALLSVVGLIQVWFLLRLWPYDARYKKGLVATGATIAGLLLLSLLPQLPHLLYLFLATLLSFSLFFGILILLGLDQEDKNFFRWILKNLRRA